jgi:DNA-binding response OmpR family regulator
MPETVMIIEGDVLVRMVLAEYLRECGYKVVEGVALQDFWKLVKAAQAIDIVVADATDATTENAFEFAQSLRQSHPQIDVILTSGIVRAAEKASDLCDDGPLPKPYHSRDVLRRIHLLRERRKPTGQL